MENNKKTLILSIIGIVVLVIAVIGVLAAVLIPTFSNPTQIVTYANYLHTQKLPFLLGYIISYLKNNKDKRIILATFASNVYRLKNIIEIARNNKVNIISTEYDTFHAAKLIGLSGYIGNLLGEARIEKIKENDYLDTFIELSSKQGYNNYPVVNKNGKYGFVNTKGKFIIKLTRR